jgi:hypothetical protein
MSELLSNPDASGAGQLWHQPWGQLWHQPRDQLWHQPWDQLWHQVWSLDSLILWLDFPSTVALSQVDPGLHQLINTEYWYRRVKAILAHLVPYVELPADLATQARQLARRVDLEGRGLINNDYPWLGDAILAKASQRHSSEFWCHCIVDLLESNPFRWNWVPTAGGDRDPLTLPGYDVFLVTLFAIYDGKAVALEILQSLGELLFNTNHYIPLARALATSTNRSVQREMVKEIVSNDSILALTLGNTFGLIALPADSTPRYAPVNLNNKILTSGDFSAAQIGRLIDQPLASVNFPLIETLLDHLVTTQGLTSNVGHIAGYVNGGETNSPPLQAMMELAAGTACHRFFALLRREEILVYSTTNVRCYLSELCARARWSEVGDLVACLQSPISLDSVAEIVTLLNNIDADTPISNGLFSSIVNEHHTRSAVMQALQRFEGYRSPLHIILGAIKNRLPIAIEVLLEVPATGWRVDQPDYRRAVQENILLVTDYCLMEGIQSLPTLCMILNLTLSPRRHTVAGKIRTKIKNYIEEYESSLTRYDRLDLPAVLK